LKVKDLKRFNLTKFFDSVDLGVDAIGDWREFERGLHDTNNSRDHDGDA